MMKLCNVIVYDGADAYVEKFVLKTSSLDLAICDISSTYGADVVKVDELYEVTLENVFAYQECGDFKLECAYQRFVDMYIRPLFH